MSSPGHFTPRNDRLPFAYEADWVPGTVWTDAENLAPIGIHCPDRPARSESLYRLSYPSPHLYYNGVNLVIVSDVHSDITKQLCTSSATYSKICMERLVG
jgi:hypothetical protein